MCEGDQLDVIVRFHDERRLLELERCIFSLVAQEYRPLHIHLVVQRFTPEAVESTRTRLDPILKIENALRLSIVNWAHPEPTDARSALLNLGLRSARGRYVAFLDYDDVLYPGAYGLVIPQLRASGAAIAFSRVGIMRANVWDTFIYATERLAPFAGASLHDLFRSNFCPIHTYVIDRRRVPPEFLYFENFLAWEEDYDLLLRLCSQFPSDFSLVEKEIGLYFYKTDSSNTVPVQGGVQGSRLAAYERVAGFIEQRRRTTPIAPEVQRMLQIETPIPGLTIRDFLDLSESQQQS